MRIQLIFEPDSAEQFLRLGRLAEELGFDAVWTANHVDAPDPFLAFSLLAHESSRLRMGPIAISPYELHPVKMANSLLALNELARGRASIVVGGGGGSVIAMNLKSGRYVMAPRMVRAVRECVEMLRAAASGEPVNYAGELFQVNGYHAGWAEESPPLIYVGATKPQMLRLAARIGDGVMFSDLTTGRLDETMQLLNSSLDQHQRAAGFRVNNLFAWHVKKDRDEARAEAQRKLWVRGMIERWYIEPFLEPDEVDFVEQHMDGIIRAYLTDTPDIDDLPPPLLDKLVDELTFCGDYSDIDQLLARCEVFKQAGVTEMALRLYDDPEDSIRLLADVVGPEL
jgi:alkanesulfonate monooxygenase SsuD/methylene tetrahydromethanopterin reductase-like flavin-dependent oxidoreductase (luciferase family)